MTECSTISSLAVKLFMSHFYQNDIPNINKNSMYNDIRNAYQGGITDVYKPKGNNLYYYDVNSLYTYVVKINKLPGLKAFTETFSIEHQPD